jgi:outer membrane receptor protein involved in Fe transport
MKTILKQSHGRLEAFFLTFLWILSVNTFADTTAETKGLFDLSLAQLMDIEIIVPASITEKDPRRVPASVTVITAEDIARTPARNLLDLIEIYVPGAIYMNHSIGPTLGIRGIIADRPYKFLINVNGINVNIKSHYGIRLELLNWDMNDIERVEIIRGPGSVTYGPGAIGGVINITTKKAKDHLGVELGGTFWNKYNSIGNYISYGLDSEKYSLYSYFSVVHTDGVKPDLFGVENATRSGYVDGKPNSPYRPKPPFTYMNDFFNEPQVKALVDLHFKDSWRFWARYANSSSQLAQGSGGTKYLFNEKYKDFRQARFRYFQFALENQTSLTEELFLKSTFGISSIDVHNIEKWHKDIENDKDNLQNIKWIWSEWEYFSRFMLNYDPKDDWMKAAVGFEYSYDMIRPAWGKDKNEGLRLADGIISGPSSDAYGTGEGMIDNTSSKYFAVGKGWETGTYAFLGEVNLKHGPQMSTLWSARIDKHDYTDYMFSPRFAWIYQLRDKEYLKFIAQRSVRMNTQEELYMSHEMGMSNQPEKLDTYELIYSGNASENLAYQFSTFFNKNAVIAWDWNERRSAPNGTLTTIGLEVEADYKKENLNLGINHSFVKQLDWEVDPSIQASGISYSDYYVDAGSGVIITGKGNDLNNWPNHATKLYANISFMDGKLTLHGDLKTLWGFEGCKDGLEALQRAGGTPARIRDVKDHNAYDLEIMANLSLSYHISKSADLTFYVQNIPVVGDSKRYSYSSGYKKPHPDKSSWIEEPIAVGVRYSIRF